jgi:NO-binding membrane sensor protein with MHYT domain
VDNLRFVLGFLPWIVFSFAAQRLDANGVAWSATIAVAMTLVALFAARRRHGPKILNIGSLVLFAAIAVVGFVGGPAVDAWLFDWGRPLVGVLLGLYVLATVPVMPFTEEYARRSVPREYWGSPTFRRVNRVLSAAWGGAIVVIGAAGLLVTALDAHAVDTSRTHVVDLLLNWVVPIAVIWGMIKFTGSYPERVRRAAGAGAAGSSPRP